MRKDRAFCRLEPRSPHAVVLHFFPAPVSERLLQWIEDGELLRAFEAMKSAYPEASLHLGNLRDAEKAYREQRISFEELGKEKARLRHAALSLLGK